MSIVVKVASWRENAAPRRRSRSASTTPRGLLPDGRGRCVTGFEWAIEATELSGFLDDSGFLQEFDRKASVASDLPCIRESRFGKYRRFSARPRCHLWPFTPDMHAGIFERSRATRFETRGLGWFESRARCFAACDGPAWTFHRSSLRGRGQAKRHGVHVADAIDPAPVRHIRQFVSKKLPQMRKLMSEQRRAELQIQN